MALFVPESETAEDEALLLVAERACTEAGCASAGVTVALADVALIIGTSVLGRQLEQSQWDAGQGPGIDAVRQFQVFNVSCLATSTSWPAFVPLAVSRGVRSSLAVPVILRGRALGALDLYSLEPGAFDGAEQVGLHFAAEAALALSELDGGRARIRTRTAAPRPEGVERSHAVS